MRLSEWFKIKFAKNSPSLLMRKIMLPTLWDLFKEWVREWLGIKRILTKSKAQKYHEQETTIESRLDKETVRKLRKMVK